MQDVQDVKRAFGVDDPWVVLGHSWGAYLALLTALRHPDSTRALVYVSGTGTPAWWNGTGSTRYKAERAQRMPPGAQRRLQQLRDADRTWAEEVELRRLSWGTNFVQQAPSPDALTDMVTTRLPIRWDPNSALSSAQLLSDDDLVEACSACTVPALFLHGSQDPRPAEGSRIISERFPISEFSVVQGAAHLPWVERQHEVVTAIRSFLDDRTG